MRRAIGNLSILAMTGGLIAPVQAPVSAQDITAPNTRFNFSPQNVYSKQDVGKVREFNALDWRYSGDKYDLAWGVVIACAVYYYIARNVELTPRQINGTLGLARAQAAPMLQAFALVTGSLSLAQHGASADGAVEPVPKVAPNVPEPGSTILAQPQTRFVFDRADMINRQDERKIARFNALVRHYSGDDHDLAWGATMAFGVYYYIAGNAVMTNRQLVGTLRLARGRFVASADQLGAMTNRDKQQSYETLAVRAVDALDAHEDTKRARAENDATPDDSGKRHIDGLNRQAMDASRRSAQAALDGLLLPDSLNDFRMTPDGLIRIR